MTNSSADGALPASFRDPSGFLFRHEGRLLRQVNASYAADLALLHESALYEALVAKDLLIPHTEAPLELAPAPGAVKVLAPELVPFISYPYEWSFTQLKDAALATLRIQRLALQHGLSLKDASAYNIQFHKGRPVMIDSLSFTAYRADEPWVAYRQFCQHFLAPLALMAHRDVRMGELLRTNIDGVPLDLAARLLPWRTRLNPGLMMHIHLHARSQQKHADSHDEANSAKAKTTKVSRKSLDGILDSLRGAVRKLRWQPGGTEWGDYYEDTNYTDSSLQQKRDLVGSFLDLTDSKLVWDVGANNGYFSRVASERGILTIASDIDPTAVEKNWLACRRGAEPNLLPLVMDLTNPSPGLGWAHSERDSFLSRGPADTVIALALIHHLCISNNVPLPRLAEFFAAAGRHLILEFVPKNDSQVKRLLASREDVFPEYHLEGVEAAFAPLFEMTKKARIAGSERTLFLFTRR
ncbi:MAG: class I SAM-dependent methyltransferase [Candidatus Krumholzibacteria bacterium]|nr:class I SAM-dependent methyltransferase [Candidatus Krumholzibacteria bacterium]